MYQSLRLAVVAAGILAATGQTARANVIYQFTQLGPMMQTPFSGQGDPFATPILAALSFTVSDAAHGAGMDFRQKNGDIAAPYAHLAGLDSLHLGLSNLTEAFSASVEDFTRPIPIRGPGYSHIELRSTPGGMPAGSIRFSGPQYMTVEFIFDGTHSVSGTAIGDGSCFRGCSFNGALVTAVPEPAGILTFGIGLLGLAAAARGRATFRG